MSKPDGVSKDAFGKRLLPRIEGLGLPDGAHLVRRQARCANASSGRAGDRSGLYAGVDGQSLAGLLAYLRRSTRPRESGDAEQQGRDRSVLQAEQRGGPQASHRKARKLNEAADQVRDARPRVSRGIVLAK